MIIAVCTLSGCFDFDAAYLRFCGNLDCTEEQADGGELGLKPADAGTVGSDAGVLGDDAGAVGSDAGVLGDDAGTVGDDGGLNGPPDAGVYPKTPSCSLYVSQTGNTSHFMAYLSAVHYPKEFNGVPLPNQDPSCIWKLDGTLKGAIPCGGSMSWEIFGPNLLWHLVSVEMTGPDWTKSCSTRYFYNTVVSVSCNFLESHALPSGGHYVRWDSNGSSCEFQLDSKAWVSVDCIGDREFPPGSQRLEFRAHGADGGTRSCFDGWSK